MKNMKPIDLLERITRQRRANELKTLKLENSAMRAQRALVSYYEKPGRPIGDFDSALRQVLLGVCLFLGLILTAPAASYLAVTNPPCVIQLAWDPSPDPTVTNYFIYSGVGSFQYTNRASVGNVTNCTVSLVRGATYYFAATAQAGGLESIFSNEISYTPKAPPGAPGLHPPVTLVVESKKTASDAWADAGMDWSLSPEASTQLFRLRISVAPAAAQVAANERTPAEKLEPPPLPK